MPRPDWPIRSTRTRTAWSIRSQCRRTGRFWSGGQFGNIGGQPRNHIARLDAVTGAGRFVRPEFRAALNVYAIVVQADGKILVCGQFSNIGGQPRNCIARLDAVTGLADSFDPNTNIDQLGGVYTMAVQADGKVVVGGTLTPSAGRRAIISPGATL